MICVVCVDVPLGEKTADQEGSSSRRSGEKSGLTDKDNAKGNEDEEERWADEDRDRDGRDGDGRGSRGDRTVAARFEDKDITDLKMVKNNIQ